MVQAQVFRRIDVAAAREFWVGATRSFSTYATRIPFSRGHIDGRDAGDERDFLLSVANAQGETVIVCCYHGNSSQAVARRFAEQGFADVSSLDGGYEAFAAAERAGAAAPAQRRLAGLSRRAWLRAGRRRRP